MTDRTKIGRCGGCDRPIYAGEVHECAATAAYAAAKAHGCLAVFQKLIQAGYPPDVAGPLAVEMGADK